jgi:hypothetical protein
MITRHWRLPRFGLAFLVRVRALDRTAARI